MFKSKQKDNSPTLPTLKNDQSTAKHPPAFQLKADAVQRVKLSGMQKDETLVLMNLAPRNASPWKISVFQATYAKMFGRDIYEDVRLLLGGVGQAAALGLLNQNAIHNENLAKIAETDDSAAIHEEKKDRYHPTTVHGFTIMVHEELFSDAQLHQVVPDRLNQDLHRIKNLVPRHALREIRAVVSGCVKKARGLYGKVRHISGKTMKAYAATDEYEYFSELTEAYFGDNNFYPFNRNDLMKYDPAGFALVEKMWNMGSGMIGRMKRGK